MTDETDKSGGVAFSEAEGASAADQVERSIKRIETREPSLKAFRDLHIEEARRTARALDELPLSERGTLHGVPIGIKEVFDVAGMRCSWGSPIHEARIPQGDAEIVAKLRDAGAVIIGTTTSTEYAMARVPDTVNPFDPARTPGASSSGSAAAVGAGLVPCALGSQTIGSGIRPAAYCGALALKPSWGLWPLQGVMPLSHWLDHPVIMAGQADMLQQLFDALSEGQEETRSIQSPDLAAQSIIVLESWYDDPISPAIASAIETAANRLHREGGSRIERASISDKVGNEEACLTTILAHDMALHHGGDYEHCHDLMSSKLHRWIEQGITVTTAQYEDALAERLRLIEVLESWLPENGIIVTAATVDTAPLRADGTGSRAPQRLWSLVGFPAMTVPVSKENGLPIGVQLIGRPGSDRQLLQISKRFELASD